MAASVSQNGRYRAIFLSVIMVLMTQVGYTDNMDFSIGLNQDTESMDTGGSTPALTPSVEGADLMVDEAMDDITFQYGTSAASGSGSNSNSGTYNGNGTAWMVKDINTGTSNNGGSMSAMYLEQDAVMGNEMYFFATDSTNGYELWKSDGTESGTVMVKDINNGSGSSMPSSSSITGVNSNLHLKAMNNTNTLFFVANDGIHGEELWKTDGTASGTVMVKDINSANGNSGHSDIGEFTQMGSTLYFRADDGTNGQELWKTDGTSSGTVMVKDINPTNANVVDCNCLRAITVVGNTLYFTADDGTHGEELWKSDGTTSGTVMVKNIGTGGLGSEGSGIEHISVAGNYIYFAAKPSLSVTSLFRSDGTAAGTVVIKANDFIWTKPTITIGNTLFFVGGSTYNATIWKSNGTSSGTTMAVDVLPQTNTLHTLGADTYGIGVKRCDRNVGNSFYFMARDHAAGGGLDTRYLWKTDGTASGTVQVKDVNNANVTGGKSTCGIIGDTLFFVKQETRQLWKTNGTPSGTKMVIDMDSLSPSGYGELNWNFASINNKLYFGASDGTNGIELWALDPANITGLSGGSGSGGGMTNVTGATCSISPALPTGLSIDSSTCTISGTPSVATSNTTYTVTANISGTTYQGTVWLATMTFGTIISPVMGAELDLGEAMTPITLNYTSQAGDATVYNGNGTAWMVKDIFAGQAAYYQGSNPQYLTAVGDTLFFNAKGAYPYGYELWKSDGTEAGTVMVKEIEPGYNQYNGGASYLTAAGDTLYFAADDGIHGLELWKSDGTEAGTVMVKDLWPGNDSSGSPNDGFKESTSAVMTAIGDIVYFAGNDGVNGYGLYKSDGTANGTEFITSPVYQMFDLVATNDTLYFQGSSTGQTADMALYKSDGTANGTVMLKNIACPDWTCRLTPAGDKLFFSNDDGSTGDELWISDGTVNGTVMVKDIAPTGATGGSYPFHTGTSVTPDPAVIGDTVFFKAYINGSYPYDWGLWKSDGTEAGTVLVSNFCCTGGSAPIVYGDSIFFSSEGLGIFRSDGTSSGTVLETNSVDPIHITGMGNTLYFSYANPDPELWAYNPTNLTLNTPPPVSWETHPELPEGMSISNGVISGTPSVYAVNQTYTVYANQSGETTTFDMYFSVDTNNPHTVVENQPIDAIGFQDPFQNGTTNWTVSPALPADLVMDANTGEITGSVNGVLANTTYTVTATHSDGATETFTFSLQSLADFDGDGLANELPSDYDAAEGPTPGLVADTDDDADGLEDVVETGTSIYVDSNNTGSNPLDPDTDDDGICDGPNAVPPICIAGPDSTPNGDSGPPIWIGLFNKEGTVLGPYKSLPGGTYEIMPDLPQSLTMDPNTGVISGTPTQTLENTTFTVWVNRSDGASLSWNFSIEILADSDGDGFPDQLPDDYNSSNPTAPGLVEDLDDDNDGIPDLEEDGGLDSTNPDTDGDGICDGVISVDPICVAGPDAFPLDPSADTDTDGDGKPDTITGNSTSVPPLEEDMDDDGDGADDINETNAGTDPLNPDTDGDGVCDGPNSVWPICINGPDSNPLGANDGGNFVLVENIAIETPIPPPNQVPGAVWEISPALPAGLDLNTSSGIITGTATEVSDNTTYTLWANVSDFGRNDSVTLSVMATFGLTVLEDSDGDGMPDELPDDYDTSTGALVEDLDDDNDGLLDTEEDGLGTDPNNPDSDGDGFCDGPTDVYADDGTLVCRGPDPEPLDSALPVDTDGDMFPDEDPDGPGGLEADTDDDGDGFSDEEENNCGSDSLDANDAPSDLDGDTVCDILDADIDGDGLNNTVETNTGIFTSFEDSGSDPLNPDTDGDGYCDGPVSPNYSNCTAGPDAFPTDPSAHLDTDGDGDPDTITGNSTTGLVEDLDDDDDGASDLAEEDCGTDPLDASETPETDSDGNCVQQDASAESLVNWNWGWCFILILLLLLLFLIPLLIQKDRILVMMGTGPEPENTTSMPEFISGAGTIEDPFVLEPSKKIKAGESISSKEVITIGNMTVNNVEMIDLNQEDNGDKFSMYETGFDEIGVRLVKVDDDGEITINMHFDDSVGGATYAGGEFTGLLKLGSASVYLSWTVTIKPDKKKLKEIEQADKEANEAEEAAAKKLAKEEAAAKKKAEEEAAAAAKEAEEEEAAAAAALLAKEEEEKTAKEAEKAAAKNKAEEEAASAATAKPATKEEKKKAELKRVKERSKSIDFKVLGTANASDKDDLQLIKGIGPFIEEKLNALGIYTYLQISKMTSKLEDTVNEAIEFFPGRVKRDQWVAQAKILLGEDVKIDEKALKKSEELARVAAKAEKIDFGTIGIASASDKDNLQELKGIGPFIEEKLNALGIFKFEQIAKMTSEIEDEVNIAIEFFPGRVKRDEWVKQAKERSKL